MRRPVLLIGLDAAEKDLLAEGIEDGALPVLRRLRDEGAWGVADALPGFGSGAIWPSFATGVSPAKHGRYFYRQVGPESYGAERFEASAFEARSVWEQMSGAGRRVAVFDVPKMGLSARIEGIEVVDWLVHGPVYHALRTQPPSLAAEIEARFGLDPLPHCDLPGGRDAAQHAELVETLCRRAATKGAAARHYLQQERWDFFCTVFGEPHCIGHQSWHVRDPEHPLHDPVALAAVGDPLLRVYRAIDAAIGGMLEAAPEDTLVLVVSCTGMGPNYSGNPLLDEVLRRLEGSGRPAGLDLFGRAKRRAKQWLPVSLRKRGRKLSRRVEDRLSQGDRESRRCFAVPHNDIAGAIRVNLVGREREGRVRPEELDAFCAALRADLLALRNLDTGGPVVEEVVRTSDTCEGDHLGSLPDLFVLWRRDAPIDRVGSPKLGEVAFRHRGNRTGDHTPESVFYARGPGVRPGAVGNVSILDFAPSLAALAGIRLDQCDGTPIRVLTGEDADEPDRITA